jgi:surface protein
MALAYRAKNTYAALPFISTWKTDNLSTGSSTNTQVKLPLVSTGTYKFTVNWGDGSSNVITTWNQAQVTHTYAAIGTYTITITGFIKGWEFNNLGDRLKIRTLVQWGCLRLGNDMPFGNTGDALNRGFFYGCENITYTTTTDILNLKGVTNTCGLFRRNYQTTKINNIEKLDVSKLTSAFSMFANCVRWNGDVSYFNTSNITNMSNMLGGQAAVFPHGSFTNMGNPDIGNWDVSKVTNMQLTFGSQYKFNQNIGNWDVSNVTDMSFMFQINPSPANPINGKGSFNNGGSDSIKNWNTSKVTNMSAIFLGQPDFDQEIGLWDVSTVIFMTSTLASYTNSLPITSGKFTNAGSNSISNWNTSNTINMNGLFSGQAQFNIDLSNWNTSKVTNMGYMFQSNSFNNAGSFGINNWDVSKVTNMSRMFQGAFGFNQPLSNWNVSLVTDFVNFMSLSGLPNTYSVENYSNLLIGWASRPVQPNRSINFSTNKYNSTAIAARAILTSAPNNWTIVDGGI